MGMLGLSDREKITKRMNEKNPLIPVACGLTSCLFPLSFLGACSSLCSRANTRLPAWWLHLNLLQRHPEAPQKPHLGVQTWLSERFLKLWGRGRSPGLRPCVRQLRHCGSVSGQGLLVSNCG